MIHSLLYGKFHKNYPEYDLFADLEQNLYKPTEKAKLSPEDLEEMGLVEDICMDSFPKANQEAYDILHIPAKFQQMDEYYNNKYQDNKCYIPSRNNNDIVAKSSGQTLQASFYFYVDKIKRGDGTMTFWNAKPERKCERLVVMI
jgi:replicative superfamily II helicase